MLPSVHGWIRHSCTTIFIAALATGCATEPRGASITEQAVTLSLEPASTGCALTLVADAYVACLRSTYAARCADLADEPSCLVSQHLNDLSNEDIIAELGLGPDSEDPINDDLNDLSNDDIAAELGLEAPTPTPAQTP